MIPVIRISPKLIRDARKTMVLGLVQGVKVNRMVDAIATAIPDKPCDNVGCDAFHIAEDCHLAPMCAGCGLYGSHVAHECAEKCSRCERKGHLDLYCPSHKNAAGWVLPAETALRPTRPWNDAPRQIGSVMEQIQAEAARIGSAPADSSATTQTSVPGQGTKPPASRRDATEQRGRK